MLIIAIIIIYHVRVRCKKTLTVEHTVGPSGASVYAGEVPRQRTGLINSFTRLQGSVIGLVAPF